MIQAFDKMISNSAQNVLLLSTDRNKNRDIILSCSEEASSRNFMNLLKA